MGWRSPIELLFWAPLDGEAPIGHGDEWLSASPDPSLAGESCETPANCGFTGTPSCNVRRMRGTECRFRRTLAATGKPRA
jgi:hypothetical protein